MRQRYAEADLRAPADPGRVTMRRLNRVEYRNTIRDLVGVDFDPTTDFPSDEIGYGFDTIGDVLTISPLLMERYLDAAEAVMERAIPSTPPPVGNRRRQSQYTEPASPDVKRLMVAGFRRNWDQSMPRLNGRPTASMSCVRRSTPHPTRRSPFV